MTAPRNKDIINDMLLKKQKEALEQQIELKRQVVSIITDIVRSNTIPHKPTIH